MKICGACEEELPRESFSGKQWKLRKSLRRCGECVTAGKGLALFAKGRERSAGDECPICSRLLPHYNNESMLYTCCMKLVCNGCELEADKRGMDDKCPFCRTPPPDSDEAQIARIQKRVKANDPEGIYNLAISYRDGRDGLEEDVPRAVELFERAAELGSKDAHYDLATIFNEHTAGEGIDKDMARALEHYEFAAKQGHVAARHNLGIYEFDSGNSGLACKHWRISAKLGDADSLNNIKGLYTKGLASKSDYADSLRGYHDAVEEMNSPERDEAKAYWADKT